MLADGYQCVVKVSISDPIPFEFANQFNNLHRKISNGFGAVGGTVGGAAGLVFGGIGAKAGAAAGTALLREWYMSRQEPLHTHDVIVTITAVVSGGIGPQRHTETVSIPRSAWDRSVAEAW